MSSGPIQGQGSTPQPQFNTEALDNAKKTDVVRLKNGKFKLGDSQGSVFNRTVRKAFGHLNSGIRASFEAHAQKATQKQRDSAFNSVQEATGHRYESKSIRDRKVTAAEVLSVMRPRKANVPDTVAGLIKTPTSTPKDIFNALGSERKQLNLETNSGNVYKKNEIAGGGRFKDILPPKHSAIQLSGRPFGANTVGEKFIAAQAPNNTNTNKESVALMHQMLYEQNTSTVVNLTNETDTKRNMGNTMALQYWPNEGGSEIYSSDNDSFKVDTTDWQRGNDYDVITLSITPQGMYSNTFDENEAKEVKVFQYHKWPDHGKPDETSYGNFSKAVDRNGELGQTVVHCKAGVGRTGTFIVTQQLKQELQEGTLTRYNLLSRASELVWEGRKDRGPAFVQKEEQFSFIIDELNREFNRLEETASVNTEVSTIDDGAIYQNHEISNPQVNRPVDAPPQYSAVSSETVMGKINSGQYNTNTEIVADINRINDPQQLEILSAELDDLARKFTTGSSGEAYYVELTGAAYARIRELDQ